MSEVEGRGPGGGPEVVVVGAGVIGCAVAFELARRGARVTIVERGRVGCGASPVAGGMLAPQVEAEGPGPALDLGLAARGRFSDWVARLSGPVSVGLDFSGILRVTHGDPEGLAARSRWQAERGLTARLLPRDEVARLAPGLAAPPTAALWVPDGQIDAEAFTLALADAAARCGARVLEGVPAAFADDGAVRTPGGILRADAVVWAAGAWTAGAGVPGLPVAPVKGERVLLRLPGHPLRLVTWGDGCYLVPKSGGGVVVGATMDPAAGFDTRPTAGAVSRLLAAAAALIPALCAAELVRASAGLRPALPDGQPAVGPLPGTLRTWVAAGHLRNGILLAPLTAERIADGILDGRELPATWDPGRFAA